MTRTKRTNHPLGFGNGSIIEYDDGIIEYRQTGKLLPADRTLLRGGPAMAGDDPSQVNGTAPSG